MVMPRPPEHGDAERKRQDIYCGLGTSYVVALCRLSRRGRQHPQATAETTQWAGQTPVWHR
jgi:hypothetical protein